MSKESARESDCRLQGEEGRDKENLTEKKNSLEFPQPKVEERNFDCYDEDEDEGEESRDLYTEIEESEVLRVLQPPPPPPPLPPRQVTLRRSFVILIIIVQCTGCFFWMPPPHDEVRMPFHDPFPF